MGKLTDFDSYEALDTIAAIATPLASAGLGVIRISGDGAIDIADRVFKSSSKTRTLRNIGGYSAVFGRVHDLSGGGNGDGWLENPQMLDECVALVFKSPHSYTGEDVVELSCHGGVYLLNQILRSVFLAGARPAEAGEFTRRAFINGMIDLTGAEAVMDLISASGKLAAKTALASKEGNIYRKIEQVKTDLLGAVANFTAFVDYPDDDIPELSQDSLMVILENSKTELLDLLSTFDSGKILREGVNTVIIGKPNVGKSTLMNLLSGVQTSIVTPVAGTTRDVVEELVMVGDVMLRLSDTAGIHETDDVVERIGVQRALDKIATASLILAVFDASQKIEEDDISLINKICEHQDSGLIENGIAIINKSDLPQKIDLEYIRNKFKHMVNLSATSGEGLDELERKIFEVTGLNKLDGAYGAGSAQPVLATERQRICVSVAVQCIDEAIFATASGLTLDAVNVSVDGAILSLLELTGEKITEVVVDEVFKRFCVGK